MKKPYAVGLYLVKSKKAESVVYIRARFPSPEGDGYIQFNTSTRERVLPEEWDAAASAVIGKPTENVSRETKRKARAEVPEVYNQNRPKRKRLSTNSALKLAAEATNARLAAFKAEFIGVIETALLEKSAPIKALQSYYTPKQIPKQAETTSV